ncbi:FAD-dependent oxidoreductase [Acetobacteraceae bacterium H6797]|nr:FAD-dependent oxidoreductase [Acetobacteraceae bacterium H6797]
MPQRDTILNIAVVGTGIAGMSAAWLLARGGHRVTVYERAARLGGHSNTIMAPGRNGAMPVDMGFIVYNPEAYPNLVALFRELGVETRASDMSFAASLRGGALEYSGTDLDGVFAQRGNLLRPRFWSMLRDLLRFYREAPRAAHSPEAEALSLGEWLRCHGYGDAFTRDHLLPMAAAIWSTPAEAAADYPAAAFMRFYENHGLLRLSGRPQWRTVEGGSRQYVRKLTAPFADSIRLNCGVRAIRRQGGEVLLTDTDGETARYDHVVIAAHSDQALGMLADPSDAESRLLGAIGYGPNDAVMHRDASLMPLRRKVWASWNYLARGDEGRLCATYWMNNLQSLSKEENVFVTLNPAQPVAPESVIHRESYEHPLFDRAAMRAQHELWSLQGEGNTWFCGAYFGSGFHEDGLQAGLAVAEQLGGLRRPWRVEHESARITLSRAQAA